MMYTFVKIDIESAYLNTVKYVEFPPELTEDEIEEAVVNIIEDTVADTVVPYEGESPADAYMRYRYEEFHAEWDYCSAKEYYYSA